jgi:HK97 family phage major capsid protein
VASSSPSWGASVFENLRGNVSLPRQTAAAQGTWLAENATAPSSDQAFDSVYLTPKRICGVTHFTLTLLRQSSLEIENVVRNDLTDVLALALGQAALVGTGAANNQPLGILGYRANALGQSAYSSRAANVTFGGPASWDAVLDLEHHCESANVQSDGSGGYVSSPATKRKWKGTPKIAGSWSIGSRIWIPARLFAP